ncbi:hypothetical protein Adt_24475 [Abeliophyllum distichum]|uniref:Uncharacterized protein n=1 Tax=Abeliophyllum distichum TaxID=126358 RepID=A0ABD1NQB9_9LAMI
MGSILPFGPTIVPKRGEGVTKGECKANCNEDGIAIDISSDDEIVCAEGEYGTANGEKVMFGGEKHNGNVQNSKKEKDMRRNSLVKSSKKLMGRSLRIDSKRN